MFDWFHYDNFLSLAYIIFLILILKGIFHFMSEAKNKSTRPIEKARDIKQNDNTIIQFIENDHISMINSLDSLERTVIEIEHKKNNEHGVEVDEDLLESICNDTGSIVKVFKTKVVDTTSSSNKK